jgi:hypothetical protein
MGVREIVKEMENQVWCGLFQGKDVVQDKVYMKELKD